MSSIRALRPPSWSEKGLTCDGGDTLLRSTNRRHSHESLDSFMPERHHANRCPKRISDEVGHTGVSGRKKCLQDFDSQADRKSKSDSEGCGIFHFSDLIKICVEKEAQRNEADDVDRDILPIIPAGMEFIPRSF